jgi:hypothetical protein
MKWVKTLVIQDNEVLEKRLLSILEYINKKYKSAECYISSVDATGPKGNELAKRTNKSPEIQIRLEDLIDVANEDGQIFELDLVVKTNNSFEINVQDGAFIDVLGDGDEIPDSVLGDHKNEDLASFGY